MLAELLFDVRFAVRQLLKNRGFALAAILTLGMGIGANTAIFSVISGVLLKPLPYADPDGLVLIRQSAPLAGRPDSGVSIKELYEYREQADAFAGLVEHHSMSFDLLNRGEPDRVSTGVVSHNFFDVLGIKPLMGRAFVEADDAPGAPAVLVLSYTYWQQKFGGDPGIIGQVFQMNDRPHTVVGVLPSVPMYPVEQDVYMSVSACPFRAAAEKQIYSNRRAFGALVVFGRLKDGVTQARASNEVEALCGRFVAENPTVYRPSSGFSATTLGVQAEMTKNARPMLLMLLGTTGLVLVIACANVANLTLARVLRREREFAIRASVGANRTRLARQLLTESLLLSLAGSVFGIAFAASTIGMLTSFVSRFTVRTGEISLDPRVMAFTLVLSVMTGVLFGIFPAMASRVDLAGAMKQGTKGSGESATRRRMQGVLIVAQVAVSVVLLVGASLLLTSFYRLQQVDPGYRADHVLSAELAPNFSKYPNATAQLAFYQPLLERISSQPGAISVAITNAVPLSTLQSGSTPFQIEGRAVDDPDRRPTTDARYVSAGYFTTLGIPVISGRTFTESDGKDAQRVVVINRSMRRYWDKDDPVGSRISLDGGKTWATVVGIVGDVRQFGLTGDTVAQVYTPITQAANIGAGQLLVRTAANPLALSALARDEVHKIDPDMPVENVRTLEDIRDRYLSAPRLTATLLALFALLAMLVTMTGLTGVIATSVSQRTHEFGLRMALGQARQSVLRMVLRQGLVLVAIGLLLGIIGSLALSRVLASLLFNTTTTDPLALSVVAVCFLSAGALACLGPAWRATTVEPMLALRAD
jgi:predicted permease